MSDNIAAKVELSAKYNSIWTCSRFGYQKVFRRAAEERGIKIEYSAPIQSVDVENTTVILRDGRTMKADLIVAADGVGSVVRPIIAGSHLERRNPVGAINIDVPLALMREDPDLVDLADENQNFWMGPAGACAAGAVRDLGVYNMCLTTEEKLGSQGEWFVKGDLGRIEEKYKKANWDPRLVKLLRLAKPEDCYVWNITDLPPLPTWSQGNTVLLGDAAHAVLPFMGMGATSCVEDGACLGECLDRAATVKDIPRLLKAFEELRKPRVESICRLSRETMQAWHLPDGEKQEQRDKFWNEMGTLIGRADAAWDRKPVDTPPSGFSDPLLQPYFRGHQAVEFVSLKMHP